MDHPVIRRTESHFRGAGGHSLLRRTWAPPEPSALLVLSHGFAEHSGRYDPFGVWFAARGYAVSAHDHRGHGRSEGARCHVRRFDDYLDDLAVALETARAERPDVPVFLVGHSMGGLITAAFARERQPDVAGIALSGPALSLGADVSRVKLLLARVLSRVAPRLRMASGLDPNGLSRDPEVVRAYQEDPLVETKMTAALGAELLRAVQRTSKGAADLKLPLLVLHGEADPLCDVEGSRAFVAAATHAKPRLITYPGLRHEIFNEPEHEQVFGDLLDWIRATLEEGSA